MTEYDEEITELLFLFSFNRRQHSGVLPIEIDPVSRKLTYAHCRLVSYQDPFDVTRLPPPARFLKKKKICRLTKKASPQTMHVMLTHEKDLKNESEGVDE